MSCGSEITGGHRGVGLRRGMASRLHFAGSGGSVRDEALRLRCTGRGGSVRGMASQQALRLRFAVRGLLVLLFVLCAAGVSAQSRNAAQPVKPQEVKRYEIRGGVKREVLPDSSLVQADSLALAADSIARDTLSKREIRRMERDTMTRYSAIFRDTMPLSRMTAISFVAPGFSQLHNRQAWKIPVLWGAVGAALYGGIQQNKCYQRARSHYDDLVLYGYGRADSDMDETQRVMLKYNTRRQLFFGGAAAAFIYFIGDGVMNYPGGATNVKIATTLSTVCPGAGQIYNKSYWKVPIVMGAFASMVMTIDWNNRGYQRFKLAYDLTKEGRVEAVERGLRGRSKEELLSYRNSYRRNRDLCIILTGAVYLINLVDAHVDAYMKTYDVSDDLNIALNPTMLNATTPGGSFSGNAMGMSMSFRF